MLILLIKEPFEMKRTIIFGLLMMSLLNLRAQQTAFWEIGALLGGASMGGDLVEPDAGSFNDVQFAYGLMARKYFVPNFALRFNLLRSRLSTDDKRYDLYDDRGFRSESPLTELSLDLEWDILGHKRGVNGSAGGISPYVYAGLGLGLINPKTSFTYDNARVQADKNADLPGGVFTIPFGAGLRFNLSQRWALALDMGLRPTFSDYLDGVSVAGNPDKNDWYGIGGLQIWYNFTSNNDRDGDGIANDLDACPDIAGSDMAGGCPDRDNDSVPDDKDKCPDISGTVALDGCPDSDNDGITDTEDACPTQPGTAAMNGCPDTDGDGLSDAVDACPNEAGTVENKGCPIGDRDYDGVPDNEDPCPDQAGPVANQGCPYKDSDGDGILDKDDECPEVVGPISNKGCPEVQQEEQDVLDFATQNVRFALDDDQLLSASFPILDEVARVMLEFPSYNLRIEGHTDDRGSDSYNLALSQARARRCYEYLQSKGVPAARMQYAGYGETRPIAGNQTEGGRVQNRRVEFSLFK
jgi:outer membrane protein OmpA-like peptidoglycan-associated protein